jgi:hypothetical protein
MGSTRKRCITSSVSFISLVVLVAFTLAGRGSVIMIEVDRGRGGNGGNQQPPIPPFQPTLDTDQDGVPNGMDQCPATPLGTVVDAHGCSLNQLAPCEGPWNNRLEYLRTFKSAVAKLANEGRITEAEKRALLKQALASGCGKTTRRRPSHHLRPGARS